VKPRSIILLMAAVAFACAAVPSGVFAASCGFDIASPTGPDTVLDMLGGSCDLTCPLNSTFIVSMTSVQAGGYQTFVRLPCPPSDAAGALSCSPSSAGLSSCDNSVQTMALDTSCRCEWGRQVYQLFPGQPTDLPTGLGLILSASCSC
jgi:hypothetical protein